MRTAGRVIAWIVFLGAITAAVVFGMRWRDKNKPIEPKFKTAKVVRGRITSKVTATGTLSARTTVQVGAQVSGRLQEINVDFNSQVTKGQIIAKIDPRLHQAAVQKASAAHKEAKANLAKANVVAEQAERHYARQKALLEQGLAGKQEVDLAETAATTSKADIAVAQGRLEATAASLSEATVNLGFTTIYSPIDGVVLSKAVDVGQTVTASLSSPTLFTIAQDLRSIQVDTFVAEADVGKLKQGMDATFTVDAYPGQRFTGKVREVRNAAQTVQNVVTYDAVLDVQNEKLELKPGMTANVTFIWAERDAVLEVPNAALRFRPPPELLAEASASATPSGSGSARKPRGPRPEGGWGGGGPGGGGGHPKGGDEMSATRRSVWILRDDKPVPVRVEIGITDGSSTEIVSGPISESDEVITEYLAPSDGAPKPTGGGGGGGMPRRMF